MMVTRRTLRGLVSLLVVIGLLMGSVPYQAVAADFTFKQDTDLQKIFEIIATLGKFNVLVHPNIRNKMSLNLKGVDPLEAMYLVANLHGLKVKKIELKGGAAPIDTYAIAQAADIEKGFEQGFTKTIRLRYAKAEDVAQIVQKAVAKNTQTDVEKDARTNSLILRGTEEVLTKVSDLIAQLDLPVPQVIIDAKVVTVDTSLTRDLGFRWNWGIGKEADGTTTPYGSGSVVALTEYMRAQPNGPFYDTPSQAKGADFFKFGDFFRQNLFFNASFSALEDRGLTRTLAAPRLLAINGAQAQLRIGDKIVFSGGPSQPPEERDTGLVMDVTPRVNKDNFITMVINVEQSTPTFNRGEFPTIKRTNTKTEVQVRDGEEILVGGLVKEDSPYQSTKIPFLGDLPLVSKLFRYTHVNPTSQELVILITPHVVKQQVASVEGSTEAPAGKNGGLGGDAGLDGDLDLGPAKGTPAPPSGSPGGGSPRPSASATPGGDIDLDGI